MNTDSHSSGSPLRASALDIRKLASPRHLVWMLGLSAILALGLLLPRNVISKEPIEQGGYSLEGSWVNTISPILPPGVPPQSIQSYITVAAGGACLSSDRTMPFSSLRHGGWVHLGGHEYATTLIQDIFDAEGTFRGTFKVRTRKQLVGKDEYVGIANVEQRDSDGTILFNRCAHIHGVRIGVEPMEAACQGL
jgi:hypothetical protein